jgi:hypothetical protein
MGLFFFIIGFTPIQEIVDINGLYTKGVVFLTAQVVEIAGMPCQYQASIIQLPSLALDVKFGCNGLEPVPGSQVADHCLQLF